MAPQSPKPQPSPKPDKSAAPKRTSLHDDPRRWFIELFIIVAIVIGLAFLVQAFVVKPFKIPSESMVPTLQIGQRVLVNRIGTWFSSPGVEDIVVFHPPEGGDREDDNGNRLQSVCGRVSPPGAMCDQPTPKKSGRFFIKRIVAGPGDRIRMVDGQLIRNGKRVEENYTEPCNISVRCNFPREITVPKGSYFMMGDNRPFSDDSRFWGPVPEDWIIGGAFATYWPPGRIGGV